MSRVAWVGIDRQIHVADEDGQNAFQLTSSVPRSSGGWGLLKGPADAWSWPTWSPDGQWLAAFAVETGDTTSGPVRVHGLALDGVHEVEWAQLASMAPIYLQWHPLGQALTVLMQQDDELVLGLIRRDRLGHVRPVDAGVPLFFNWTPDGSRLLLHVAVRGGGDGRIVLRDPLGDSEDVPYDVVPGSFCAPVFAGGRAVIATRPKEEGRSEVVSCAIDGTDRRTLTSRRGLLAIVGAPLGLPYVAVSHAPRGEGSAYRGIEVLDVHAGIGTKVSSSECAAFFWAPTGEWLLFAEIDREANCIRWRRAWADGRGVDTLATFWPTRDLRFFLHFFDQYAGSHSPLSADARTIVYAGYPAGGGQADLSAPPRIYVKDTTDPDRAPEEIGRGSFAAFSPVA